MARRYGSYGGRDLPPAKGRGLGQVSSVLDQIIMIGTTKTLRGQPHKEGP